MGTCLVIAPRNVLVAVGMVVAAVVAMVEEVAVVVSINMPVFEINLIMKLLWVQAG
jgi:hypothetical protein